MRHASTPSTNSSRWAWTRTRAIGASSPAGRWITRALAEGHDAGDRRVLRAREDVDRHAHAPELAGDLADVHVHAAGLLAAQRGKGARVDAQHRDVEVHRILTW